MQTLIINHLEQVGDMDFDDLFLIEGMQKLLEIPQFEPFERSIFSISDDEEDNMQVDQ